MLLAIATALAVVATMLLSGCYRQSSDEITIVEVDDKPPMVAQRQAPTEEEPAARVQMLDIRCYEIRGTADAGEQIRAFFRRTFVDEEAMEHYRREFGNPNRSDEEPRTSDEQSVFCDYVPAANREFMVFVGNEIDGIHVTDEDGFLMLDDIENEEGEPIIIVDEQNGHRIPLSPEVSVDDLELPPADAFPASDDTEEGGESEE
jgi:hypothetical protein